VGGYFINGLQLHLDGFEFHSQHTKWRRRSTQHARTLYYQNHNIQSVEAVCAGYLSSVWEYLLILYRYECQILRRYTGASDSRLLLTMPETKLLLQRWFVTLCDFQMTMVANAYLTVTTEFTTMIHATTYVNLVGIACCCFMLLSFAVLPVEATRRHYLSVCLAFAVLLMQVSESNHLSKHRVLLLIYVLTAMCRCPS
jgi:hypothetical protein